MMSATSSVAERNIIGIALLACMVLGGGTERGLLMDDILRILVLAASAWVIVTLDDRPAASAGWGVLAAVVMLGFVQVMPLPCDWVRGWRPEPFIPGIDGCAATSLSLSSYRTVDAILSAMTGISLFLALTKFDEMDFAHIARFVVAGVLINLALSFAAFSQSDMSWLSSLLGYHAELGAFQNENHYSVFVAVGMFAALTVRPLGQRRLWTLLFVTLVLLFLLAAGSRAGVLIGLFVSLMAFQAIARGSRSAAILAPGLVLLACGYLYGLWIKFTEVVGDQILDRRDYAVTTWAAIRDHWPLGTGFGTFDKVYPHYEPLDQLYSLYVNHVHNDFLEIFLEGGIPAAVIVAASLTAIVVRFVALRDRYCGCIAFFAVLSILAHSAVDYPLRTMAVTSLFAFFCALLFAPGRQAPSGGAPSKDRRVAELEQAAQPAIPMTLEGDRRAL